MIIDDVRKYELLLQHMYSMDSNFSKCSLS